jgi:hypothetical protein
MALITILPTLLPIKMHESLLLLTKLAPVTVTSLSTSCISVGEGVTAVMVK